MKTSKHQKLFWIAGISGLSLTIFSLADLVVPAVPPAAPEVVDQTAIITFEAGKAASAAEMNQTIQELIRVIDLNGQSLQQLRDRVAPLEEQVVTLAGQVAALQPNGLVAGRKYKIAQMILLFENGKNGNTANRLERFADSLITW